MKPSHYLSQEQKMFFRKIKLFFIKKWVTFFNSTFRVRNCGVPCCDGQRFIKFIDGKAVIPTWGFFQIVRHYQKNIQNLCGIACSDDRLCHLHRKLNYFQFFSNSIRQKNINNNIILKKLMIRDNCKHPYCLNSWCFEIYETAYVGYDKPLPWRSKFF